LTVGGGPPVLPQGGGYADINGLHLYYEVHGRGRPLLLLAGGLQTFELCFGDLVPALATDHLIICAELQGHGRTADTGRPMALPQLADDMAQLIGHLGVAPADVFGFSLGGIVALELALGRPDLVGRLVLGSVDYRPGHEEAMAEPTPEMAARLPTEADFQAMRDAYTAVAPEPGHFDAFAERTSSMVHALEGWSDDEMRSLRAPTLLVVGDTDFTPLPHAVALAELIPRAQLAVLPGTTHMRVPGHEVLLPLLRAFLA
jgi:pimeloyl-ACP methyl ester carboxylesterase